MTHEANRRRFEDKRVLVTSADQYMGPAIAGQFRREGAFVVENCDAYDGDAGLPAKIIAAAGHIDVLIINLGIFRGASVQDVTEDDWQFLFDSMVHPTMRFVKAVAPQMIARQAGKIIVVTSAAPLRAVADKGASGYTAARGAQNAYVRAAGAELAPHNIQLNAIAQNFTIGGYPENAMEIDSIRQRVMQEVPARRLAEGWEQAELTLFLASQDSNFFVGQVIPFTGGWVTT